MLIEPSILIFILVGFLAQVVDGALGMGYGVLSTSVLLSLGLPPAIASASVHTAEVFVTGVSGLAHLGNGNVERRLVFHLVVPGILGGILGAYVLTQIPGEQIKPVVAVYLLVMGVVILRRAFMRCASMPAPTRLAPLGFAGGFLDSVGGGGGGDRSSHPHCWREVTRHDRSSDRSVSRSSSSPWRKRGRSSRCFDGFTGRWRSGY
jgi:uncharacterized membrane protein YfcA